jgi:hypothetical protein
MINERIDFIAPRHENDEAFRESLDVKIIELPRGPSGSNSLSAEY